MHRVQHQVLFFWMDFTMAILKTLNPSTYLFYMAFI